MNISEDRRKECPHSEDNRNWTVIAESCTMPVVFGTRVHMKETSSSEILWISVECLGYTLLPTWGEKLSQKASLVSWSEDADDVHSTV